MELAVGTSSMAMACSSVSRLFMRSQSCHNLCMLLGHLQRLKGNGPGWSLPASIIARFLHPNPLVAGSIDGHLYAIDVHGGEILSHCSIGQQGFCVTVTSMALSSRTCSLAVGCMGGVIHFVDGQTLERKHTVDVGVRGGYGSTLVAFHPTSPKLFAACNVIPSGNCIFLAIDEYSREVEKLKIMHEFKVATCKFSPSGNKVAVAGWSDNDPGVQNAYSHIYLFSAGSLDGPLEVLGDWCLRAWDYVYQGFEGYEASVMPLAYSPDGDNNYDEFITSCDRGLYVLASHSTERNAQHASTSQLRIADLSYAPHGSTLAMVCVPHSCDTVGKHNGPGLVKLLDTSSFGVIQKATVGGGQYLSMCVAYESSGGKIAVSCNNEMEHEVHVFDALSLAPLHRVTLGAGTRMSGRSQGTDFSQCFQSTFVLFELSGMLDPQAVVQDAVVQEVVHPDLPAQRDAELAALQQELDWADEVQTRIARNTSTGSLGNEASADEEAQAMSAQQHATFDVLRVASAAEAEGVESEEICQAIKFHMCTLNRSSKELRRALCEGPELKLVRDAIGAEQWMGPNGSLIFVDSESVQAIREHLDFEAVLLHPSSLVVSTQYLYLVEEVLDKHRMWCKHHEELVVVRAQADDANAEQHGSCSPWTSSSSDRTIANDALDVQLVVQRTFIQQIREMPPSDSVTQSTTQRYSRGSNPRLRSRQLW